MDGNRRRCCLRIKIEHLFQPSYSKTDQAREGGSSIDQMTTNERRMMMMNNVMSMELALQREQTYKAKNNERLQLQLQQTLYDDDEHEHEPPLQIEGPPSNLELVGMNQKASFENLSLSQVRTSEPTEGQMTNERITSNVMSVELAMQRELAYRAKIERLQLQPRYDAEEPPLQIEGPASNLKLVGMNQKENLSHSQVRTSEPILFKREVACERLREETTTREATDDRVKRNIMPVELAIQRELANQRKMESVRFQPHNESKETPVPFQRSMNRVQFQPHNHSKETPVSLQGAPSKPTNAGTKRIVPYGNPRYQPPQKKQSTHRQQGLGKQSQLPVSLYCKFCHVLCPGPSNYKQHCRGRKHKATLQQMNGQRNGAGAWPFWCDVCMIPCMNEESFQMHLAGKKHALQATKNAGIV